MELAGYLELDNGERCVTVVDNWATTQLAAADPGSLWELAQECPECACETASSGITAIADAPWFDEFQPASSEFFGLYGSLRLSQPAQQTVFTGTGRNIVAPLKTLTFVGVVAARSSRGAQFGLDWLSKQLEPSCPSCDGVTGRVSLWCPDVLCIDDGSLFGDEPVVTEANWCLDGIEGCEAADSLGLTPDPVLSSDSGRREIPDLVYLAGSLQEIQDIAAPLPTCHGVRVTFSFTVQGADRFAPLPGGCLMRSPVAGECDTAVCCTDLVWELDTDQVECGCVESCDCAAVEVAADPGAVDVLPDGAAECRYSTPLCSQTYACLTDVFAFSNAVPTISITSGLFDLFNVSVTIWEARAGLPNPTTAEGFEFYEQIPPVVDRALIHRIPAQSTLVLDGESGRELLSCAGAEPVPYPVTRCGGRKYLHPRLCCGRRYWVAFEVGCDQQGTWEVLTTLSGVERV